MFIFIKRKKSSSRLLNTMNWSPHKRTVITMGVGTVMMMVIIGIVIGINMAKEKKELLMVHIIMRHGARTPADTYPTDPHINDTLYPVGWGQLTNEGKMQAYEIGKFLRERYDTFLGDYYWPDEYYTQSTDVDRTKTSVQTVNAGLWPPTAAQMWGPLKWQPIPVHAELLSEDMLLLVRKPCAAYHKERDQVIESEEIQNKLRENEELFIALTEHTGRAVNDFDDVQDVFSTLRAEECFNMTLPEWTGAYYPEKMLEPTIFSYILNAWNDRMNRFKGGVLLKKIQNDWQSKVDGTITPQSQKAFLYGGHDSTVVNLLRTLNVWDTQLPDYGIMVLLELSKNDNEVFGIEIFLRNSTEVPPFKLTIPGCDAFCPLNTLIDLTHNVIPEDWEEECENDGSYFVPEPAGP